MKFSTRLRTVLLVVLLGCAHESHASKPSVQADRPVAQARNANEGRTLCEAVAIANNEHITSALNRGVVDETKRTTIADKVRASELLPPLDSCVVSASGVWSIEIESIRISDEHDFDGTWVVAFQSFSGRKTTYRPPSATFDDLSQNGKLMFKTGVASVNVPKLQGFDFDGDGEQEVYLAVSYADWWSSEHRFGRLLTHVSTSIREYPYGSDVPISEMRDVDHDGRPDLIVYPNAKEDCAGEDHPEGKCWMEWGKALVLLSKKDGGFVAAPQLNPEKN